MGNASSRMEHRKSRPSARRSRRFWCAVAAKAHVDRGARLGFAQVCHGKARPLSRMSSGDGIVYYSPALERGGAKCQCFSSIGLVADDEIYQADEGHFSPYRRNVTYLLSDPVSILPLLSELSFTAGRNNWGVRFRNGHFEIPVEDFGMIMSRMCPGPLRRARAGRG